MKTIKAKLILLVVTVILVFTACSSKPSESKIISNAKEIIDADLSDDISANKCLYNEEENAVYLKFYSFEHGNDEAIIFLDDNSVFYEGIYSTIKEDDYDKIIEYGDYTIMKYQIDNNDEKWVEIELQSN
jgi:hypothetical protein